MKKNVVTIIIPVFNAEKYLENCLKSVINQTYKNIEIIIVDDGSTDNSFKIYNKYLNIEKRLKVINIENSGVSKARNIGLENSNGEWVTFIDADDWLERTYVEVLVENIIKYDGDVIGCNCNRCMESGEIIKDDISPAIIIREDNELEIFKLDTIFMEFDSRVNKYNVGEIRCVWGKLFKTSIINNNNIKFKEGMKLAEDALFCYEVFSYSKKVILLNRYLINYRVHSESANNRYRDDMKEVAIKSIDEFRKVIGDDNLKKSSYKVAYNNLVAEFIYYSIFKYFYNDNYKKSSCERYKEIKKFFKYKAFKDVSIFSKNITVVRRYLLLALKVNNPIMINIFVNIKNIKGKYK